MANRYWVGGGDTWNGAANSKWSTTSGGAGGAAVPTDADDVFFDAASGAVTITISASRACRSFNCTGFTGTLQGALTPVLSIGDASGGAMTLSSGMTLNGFSTPAFTFVSTSDNGGAGWPLTFAGRTILGITFAGAGGKWVLQDAMSSVLSIVSLTAGTLDTNNQNVSFDGFNTTGSTTRALILGTTTWTINATVNGTGWIISSATNFTLSAASSTINFTGITSVTRSFAGAGLNYGTVNYVAATGSGLLTITGSNSFNALNIGSGRAVAFEAGSTQTVTSLSLSGAKNDHVKNPGGAGNYISAPDSSALDITGDITLMARVALDDYTPIVFNGLIGKRITSGNQRSYYFGVNISGFLSFAISTDGTSGTVSTVLSSAATGLADGSTSWLLVSRRSSDGRTQFFTASGALTDPAASDFTQLGTDQTATSGAIFSGSANLEIGSTDGGTLQNASAKFYRVKIYNGLFSTSAYGGTVQFDADFSSKTMLADSFTESSANAATVTLNGQTIYGDGRLDISSTTSSPATLSTTGIVAGNYMRIANSTASGGATYYAGGSSVDQGGNTGWIFAAYGAGNFFQMF